MLKNALVPAVPPLHIADIAVRPKVVRTQTFGQGRATHLAHPAVHVDGHLRSGGPVLLRGRVFPEVDEETGKIKFIETVSL